MVPFHFNVTPNASVYPVMISCGALLNTFVSESSISVCLNIEAMWENGSSLMTFCSELDSCPNGM